MKKHKQKIWIILSIVGVLALLSGGIYLGVSQAPNKKAVSTDEKKNVVEKESSKGQRSSTENSEQEFSPRGKGFILEKTSTYEIDDSTLNASIAVSPISDTQVKADISLLDSTQNFSYTGDIRSPSMAELLLDEGERILLIWSDELHLKAVSVGGYFSEKTLSDMKALSDCLDNKLYTATIDDEGHRPSPSSVAVHMPANGSYHSSTNGKLPNTCEIRMYAVDDMSFKFSIWESFDSQGEVSSTILVPESTAVFENKDGTTAIYKGEEHTITFDLSEFGKIKLSGFDAATQVSDTFLNMMITNY